MARHIDMNEIKFTGEVFEDRNNEIYIKLSDVKQSIEQTPTADVEEVVRCGKCKHWSCHGKGKLIDEEIGMCYNNKFPFCCESRPITIETDFCSYGERRDA
jgi:hypothetical protein